MSDIVDQIQNTKASDYRTIYSNNVATLTGFFDFSMIFGEVQAIDKDGLHVEQKAKVIMAPGQAKVFFLLLWQQLNAVEEKFGTIEVLPEIVPEHLRPFLERYNEAKETASK